MKKLILLSMVAGALAFAARNASADLVVTLSGTGVNQKSNTTTSTAFVGTTESSSFNNKQPYTIISNALANASAWSGGAIASTNVPANGYIAFNPGGNDGAVQGIFYVTNKSGVYWPLSGFDANGEYFSWMELDVQNTNYEVITLVTGMPQIQFGWVNQDVNGGPVNGVAAYNVSNTTGNGSETVTSTALFYLHDDPYCYDDADNPNIFWGNYLNQGDGDDMVGHNSAAAEIRGIMTGKLTIAGGNIKSGTLSLAGTGNLAYGDQYGFLVTSGKAGFAQ
jgi:hypothetical protein